jgi:hypothetical protein
MTVDMTNPALEKEPQPEIFHLKVNNDQELALIKDGKVTFKSDPKKAFEALWELYSGIRESGTLKCNPSVNWYLQNALVP